MLATIYFVSLAMKHQRFAAALINKAEHVRLRDILTITCERTDFRASLFQALDYYGSTFDTYTPLTEQEADTILKVLSVRRDNLDILKPSNGKLLLDTSFLIGFKNVEIVPSHRQHLRIVSASCSVSGVLRVDVDP